MSEETIEETTEQDDLAKFEKELSAVNEQLSALDAKRNELVRHGVRIEGIVAYLRQKGKEEGTKEVEAEKQEASA